MRAQFHVPPAEKRTHASGHTCTGARSALLMETSKSAQSYTLRRWGGGEVGGGEIVEIDRSKALTRRNLVVRQAKQNRRGNSRGTGGGPKQIRSKCAFRCHITRDPHAQVTIIYARELSANWTCTNKLTTSVSQLSKDRMPS